MFTGFAAPFKGTAKLIRESIVAPLSWEIRHSK